MPGSSGAEVVLIEFIGDSKSAVAASEETVAGLDSVAAAADRAAEAQQAQGAAATSAAKESKTAAAQSTAAAEKQTAAVEQTTTAQEEQIAAQKRAAKVTRETQAATLGQSAAWKKNTAAIGAVGSGLTKYVSLPMLAIGAVATKMSLDFSKAMLLIETHTDTSRKMVDRYRKSIMAMSASGKYTQGPKELAEAMYHVASDGYKGSEALEVLSQSAHLATLGQSNLAETTYALVSVMKTGIKGTNDMHTAIGAMNAIVGAGDMQMQDLVGAMSTGIMPAAKGVGLSLKDVGAALDVMTQRGVPAQQAAYRLSMNFQQLVPYTEKAQDAFKNLGLGQYEIAKQVKGPTGFLDALKLLQSHLDKFGKYQQGTIIRDIFGGGRTSRGMLMLLQNLKSLEETYGHINHLQGETDKNLKTAMKSPANVWAKEWAKLQGTLVEVGNELVPVVIPALKDVAGAIRDFAGMFNKLPGDTKKWVIELGIAAVALGPILKMVSGMAGMVTKIGGTSLFGGAAATTVETAGAGAAAGAGAGEAGAAVGAGEAGAAAGVGGGAAAAGGAGVVLPATLAIGAAYVTNEGRKKLEDKVGKSSVWGNALKYGSVLNPISALEREHEATQSIKKDLFGPDEKVGKLTISPRLTAKGGDDLPKLQATFTAAMTKLELSAFQGKGHMGERLNEALKTALASTNQAWATGTTPWRKHTAEAMQAAVHEIRQGMNEGKISAGKGQKEIDRLLEQIHLVKGNDPVGVAEGVLSSFKKAHSVTEQGVTQLEHDLQKMPPKAREQAQNSILGMAQEWAKGHPKIEAEVDKLRHNLNSKFGKTNKALIGGTEKAVETLGGLFGNLGETVSEALAALGLNVNSVLKALGVSSGIHFTLHAGKSAVSAIGGLAGSVKEDLFGGEGKAGGGFLGGKGLRDTIPIMAAPGEAILNRHQQAPVEHALRSTYGFGLSGLFQKEQTPHYMAKGGLVEPHMDGPEPLRSGGQDAIHKGYEAAKKYVAAHRPKGGGGIGHFSGPWVQVMEKIAKQKGWSVGDWRKLVNQESGGDPTAVNPSSGAFGLGQFLGSTLQAYKKYGAGSHNPSRQIEAMAHYIADRYGSPTAAWAHETSAGWYAKGGFVLPDRDAPKGERDQVAQLRKMGLLHYAAKGKAPSKEKTTKTTKEKAPSALETMVARMKQLAAWHIPYREEHVGFSEHPAFLDCSASVSDVLHAGGFLDKEEVSGELESFGEPGPGKATIFANAGHAFMNVLGRYWGTSVDDGGAGGLGFHPAPPASYLSGFTKRHVPDGELGGGISGSAVSTPVPKQVTGKYVKTKAGGTTAAGGTVAEPIVGHYKAQTSALSFGSIPTTLHDIQKEINELRHQTLPQYQAAVRHTKDPKTKHGLEVNVKAIKARIRELVKARTKLMAEKRKEAATKTIERRGVFPDLEKHLEKLEGSQEAAAEHAEHVADLEPEDRSKNGIGYAGILNAYMEATESPAWGNVLGAEATWRNAILKGEGTVTQRIAKLEGQLAKIEALKGSPAYKKQKFRIAPLKASIASAKTVFDPATVTGTMQDELVNVQGHVAMRETVPKLPTIPNPDSFGGMIFDTQMTVHDLGLKLREAKKAEEETEAEGTGEEENTAFKEASKAIAEQARKGQALAELQYGPFAEFLKNMPPYVGAFKSGGYIPGPPNQAYTATVHGGETIVPAGGGAAPAPVEFHLHGDIAHMLEVVAPGLTKTLEQKMGQNYRRVRFSPAGGG